MFATGLLGRPDPALAAPQPGSLATRCGSSPRRACRTRGRPSPWSCDPSSPRPRPSRRRSAGAGGRTSAAGRSASCAATHRSSASSSIPLASSGNSTAAVMSASSSGLPAWHAVPGTPRPRARSGRHLPARGAAGGAVAARPGSSLPEAVTKAERGLCRSVFTSSSVRTNDAAFTGAANQRSGSSTGCAAVGVLQPTDDALYFCFTCVPSDTCTETWTYHQNIRTGVRGWTRDDLLRGDGSFTFCGF